MVGSTAAVVRERGDFFFIRKNRISDSSGGMVELEVRYSVEDGNADAEKRTCGAERKPDSERKNIGRKGREQDGGEARRGEGRMSPMQDGGKLFNASEGEK